ncbi:restriction endonuclease subunit S [Patescibacteria group bacterium]|nr:restriction endonuclease subunit S [Patescibacteria group bacterium]
MTKNNKQKNILFGWSEYKMNDIGKTYPGITGKDKDDFGKGKPFVSYMNVYSNSKTNLNIKTLVDISDNENQNRVKYGDIFFTTSSETPNEVGMSSVLLSKNFKDLFLNSFCFGFRLNNFKIIIPEFARFYFRGRYFRKEMTRIAQGISRFNLSKKYFLYTSIVVPDSIEEQNKIVQILETWDNYLEKLNKKIEIKKQIKKGLMQNLLTGKVRLKGFNDEWKNVKLGDVCKLYQPKTISSNEINRNGKYLVYGANGVIGRYDKYNHEESEVLITCRGATCGRINFSKPKSWITGNAMVAQPIKNRIDKLFLFYLLNKINLLNVVTGLAQPQITRKDLSPFNIFISPLKEQQAIAEILSSADREIESLEKKKKIVEAQKKFLLNNLISGKIRHPEFINS